MGRRKLEMKRIEDKNSRQVTFSKRRNGLIKKARELSVLCDVDIAVIVFSRSGKLYESCSGNSLPKIIERYWTLQEAAASKDVDNTKIYCSDYASLKSPAQLLQVLETHLEGPNCEQLSVSDLLQLEEQFNVALSQTRARKTELILEYMKTMHEKERMMRDENERLETKIAAMTNGSDNDEIVKAFDNCSNHISVHPHKQATLSLLQ